MEALVPTYICFMDLVLIIIGSILLLLGVVGCIAPIIPGPPIAYFALIAAEFHSTAGEHLTGKSLFWYAVVAIAATVIDYFLPIWGTKKFGGTDAGKRGSIVGLILAFIFPIFGPLTILIGPFLGALIGELITGQDKKIALRSGLGSFLGFVGGVILKLGVVVYIGYKFVAVLVA